jgi:hypothetical protein
MPDINLKTETPDTTLPTTGFLFGADSQAAASPSVYSTQAVATTLLGSTSLTGATVTTSQPLLDLTQTWNAGAVTFTGWKLNVTDTASASGSFLLQLQTGGTDRFTVAKNGNLTANGATVGSAGFATYPNGILYSGTGLGYTTPGLALSNTSFVMWSSSDYLTTPDLLVGRRGAANLRLGAADAAASATVTITIATPGVVTWSSHGLSTGTPVIFSTTGALPTGITSGTTYYVIAVDTNTFRIATTLANALAGTAVNTSGSQSGTHTGQRGAITQTSSVQSVVAGTTNFPGADKIITGSQGTGNATGGSIIFQVAPAGSSGSAQNALATALTITADRNSTFTSALGGYAEFGAPNNQTLRIYGDSAAAQRGIRLTGVAYVSWAATTPDGVGDTFIYRDAANTLALRNGANAQQFNLYNTYTDASNNEFIRIWYSSNLAFIQSTALGSGTPRQLIIGTTGGVPVTFRTNNTDRWSFDTSGHFVAATDNTYDIGASGATRPRDLFLGRNLVQVGAYHEMAEMTAPAAPATNSVRIYAEDNGSSKTRLMARFATGAAVQIAIEP